MNIDLLKMSDPNSMEFFAKDMEKAMNENRPCWIKLFSNGVCISGSGFDSIKKFLTMEHMGSNIELDIMEYDILHPSEKIF